MTKPCPELQCRIETRRTQWESLEPHWNRLLAQSSAGTPWQSHDFLTLWWDCLSAGRDLRLVIVERGGVPCLVLPWQRARTWLLGLPLRILEPIGAPHDINRPLLALGAPEQDALRLAFETLWAQRQDWDAIRLDEQRPDDPLSAEFRVFAAGHGLYYRETPFLRCPYLDLRQDWAGFLQSRSKRLRQDLRHRRNRLEAIGPVRVAVFTQPAEISDAFRLVLAIHERSWKRGKKIGLSRSKTYRDYFSRLVTAGAEKNAVRIAILFCGDQPVAGTIAFTWNETYFGAQSAFDEAYAGGSPGTLLEGEEIQSMMAGGNFKEMDFMGGALQNKLRWTDSTRDTVRLMAFRGTLRAALIRWYHVTIEPRSKTTGATPVPLPTE